MHNGYPQAKEATNHNKALPVKDRLGAYPRDWKQEVAAGDLAEATLPHLDKPLTPDPERGMRVRK
jgi:hypothetical protein